MRTVVLASLRTYARRYVAAGVAVAVSVAFVAVVGVLVSGALAGIMQTDGSPFRAADVVVEADPDVPHRSPACCPELMDPAVAIGLVDRLGNDAGATGRVQVPAETGSGTPLGTGDGRGETTVGPIADAPDMRWQKLVAGRFPAGPGEAVMHVWDAQSQKIAVGDRVRVGVGGGAGGAGTTDLAVVGLVESPSTWTQASLYVTWAQYAQWRGHPSFHVGEIAVRGNPGPLPPGTVAIPAMRYVTDSLTRLNNGTDAFAVMGVVFTGAALLVSALVIANTFAVLFARREREFALLRCVGATRRQVTGSVRHEAAAVGALASLAGTLAGVGLGYGLVAVLGAPLAVPALPVPWLAGAFALGLLVTLGASWLPTRLVVRVHPLAALRPQPVLDARTATGRVRLATAALLLVAGLALLAAAVLRHDRVLMLTGGATLFIGVLLVGPRLVPPLVRVAGTLLGPGARPATRNAVRNPRRTATTTAALMVGVTLAVAVLTGMATWRTAMDDHRDTRLPIDATLASLDRPLPAELPDEVRSIPGVEQTLVVDGAVARISAWDAPIAVVAAPDAGKVARDGGEFTHVQPGTIVLDHEAFRGPHSELRIPPGGRVTVRAGDRQVELTVVRLGGWGRAGVVAPQTLAQLTDTPRPHVLWVRTADDADRLRLTGALNDLAGTVDAQFSDRLQVRAVSDRQLDVLTWSLLAFIGVSLAVAVVGIANTLGLSALERAHEHALLRALGLTRRGLRRLLATEALLLAVVATALGTVLGIGFAWAAYRAVVRPALTEAAIVVPWMSLGAVLVGAVLVGPLAAILPAHRAARVAPAAGLSPD
ncbi:FtsX-like permease family protein [Pseudonocardia endophytica]|uniref:Putative ABC transport system permease protein n=1 Tax=Pseudonocardia endophytica TaxID=401976 RepID=A0A4R1HUH8_PSEEN|nr:ABC transporter permease [Pseudonocardia endophytica]TCK24605.1 putative ABC transport system permease protein [Pseudonocardia endophytica]